MRKKGILYVVFAAAVAAALGACGNPLEGGSEPSGSILHIDDFSHSTAQDIFFCEGTAVEYATASFTVRNDSRPNFEDSITTADGTNSRVTLYRYRVDYAVLNMSATLPGLDGGGIGGTIEPDGEADIAGLLIITEAQLEFIRSNYPQVGNGQAMVVRADVTIWGRDEFQVDTTASFSATIQIDDFGPCNQDEPPADEEE